MSQLSLKALSKSYGAFKVFDGPRPVGGRR